MSGCHVPNIKDENNEIKKLNERIDNLENILLRDYLNPVRVCPTCNGEGMVADDGKL